MTLIAIAAGWLCFLMACAWASTLIVELQDDLEVGYIEPSSYEPGWFCWAEHGEELWDVPAAPASEEEILAVQILFFPESVPPQLDSWELVQRDLSAHGAELVAVGSVYNQGVVGIIDSPELYSEDVDLGDLEYKEMEIAPTAVAIPTGDPGEEFVESFVTSILRTIHDDFVPCGSDEALFWYANEEAA